MAMQIIKECNLQALQAHYGTDLGKLDSRVTGRNVLSGGTPGISPSYGEWIEFVINLTLNDLVLAQAAMTAYNQAVEDENQLKVQYLQKTLYAQNAKDAYNQAVKDDTDNQEDLEDAYNQAVEDAQNAEDAYNQAVEVLAGMLPYDRLCLLRFENPSPIKICQVDYICEFKDGEGVQGRVNSIFDKSKMLITIKNDKRTDGWYDCRVLCTVGEDLGEIENHIEQPISIFLRFWRVYN